MLKSDFDFTGKRVLVTGGTRGIGKAFVEGFSKLGARVVYTGTKKPDQALSGAEFLELNLSEDASVAKAMAQIPPGEILVNNAGINAIGPIDKLEMSDFEKIHKVNLEGAARLTQEVSRKMIQSKTQGKILNVASILGLNSRAGRSSYSSSKAGLIGLTKASALDLAPYGILVNAICPGFTRTDLTERILGDKGILEVESSIPLGRLATVEEMATAGIFLCSDFNRYMTGQVLVVDGGYTVKQ